MLGLALPTAAQNELPKSVPAADAADHIIHRVEPTTPALAKAARIGGKVKLRIVISSSGDVSTVTVLSGHPLLIQAAIDAVEQWKYKPFSGNGNSVEVTTDVELEFAGGMSEKESDVRNKFFSVEQDCRQLINDARYADGERKCKEAVALSNKLPSEVVLERSDAKSLLANAIFLQGRFSEAILFYEQALKLDKGYLRPDDADLATDYANLARAYAMDGELPKADDLYAKSMMTYSAAIQSLPSMYEKYSRRLQRTLYEYAQLKDGEKQTDAASDLRKQASEITPFADPNATVPAFPAPTRVLVGAGSMANKSHTEMKCTTPGCTQGTFAVHGNGFEPQDSIAQLGFTPDSRLLLAARRHGKLDVMDTSSWATVQSIDTGQNDITALTISPDGTLAATGSHGNTVKVWDIRSAKLVAEFLADSTNLNEYLEYLAFSPDATLLATGGNFTKGLVLDLRTHHSVAALGGTKEVLFSSDGRRLIGAVGQKVLVWDTQSWSVVKAIEDPEKNVTKLVMDEPNNRIAITGWKKGIRILRADTGEVVKSIPDAVSDTLTFTPGWDNVITGRGTLGVWSMQSAKLICETPEMEVSEAILSPDGKVLVAAVGNGIDMWATVTLKRCIAAN
jgi:TonB family protein